MFCCSLFLLLVLLLIHIFVLCGNMHSDLSDTHVSYRLMLDRWFEFGLICAFFIIVCVILRRSNLLELELAWYVCIMYILCFMFLVVLLSFLFRMND